MRLGVGGSAFGIGGGISTRGVGVGVGPFSVGTSWRGSGGGGLLAWLVVGTIFFLILGWPYLLGTYLAVQWGAFNPSTERFVLGWCFETVYVGALAAWFVKARSTGAQKAAEHARHVADMQASGAVYEAKSGPSVVYRHGTCTVNHRSADTAARCTKSTHHLIRLDRTTADAHARTRPAVADANKLATFWGGGVLAVGLITALGIYIADPIHSAAADALTKPCPSGTSSASISIPDLAGQNAGTAKARLMGMGFSAINLSSANPRYDSVIVPENWTVVSTDPAAHCAVNRDENIVVYVNK